ncbi:MAG TPA: FtsK/SpoIIIE domain-containing protein, partial [Tepidisphaeraceae bacterium]
FMHLADHDDALVGGRIWTESEHIEQRLEDLTEHMETVIQKYLRNEYETIDDYNAQAGELAEPYRFLVIADFPVGFGGDAFRRLSSIVSSGARCGVYTLILRDTRQALPAGTLLDDLEAHSVNLVQEGDHFIWKDEVFGQFPLRLDRPPSEEFLTQILDVVGRYAKEAKRVEVPFDSIAPDAGQFWSGNSSEELRVPVGRLGATRLQMMKLGRGVAQHVLIAGKTGSGKSTLLHALVTNLAMWYSPDEVEFYLVDFKKGVEFKTYATHALPHARAIAVESDREFGLSVLQRLDAELGRRGDLFRKAGVQDVAAYRGQTGAKMPRTLLIIDEFQEFFSEDDKLAQEAGLLLDRLVRQGRAFGIHVILGSQTIGGTSGLARSTIGQMAVRVALQTSEADSQLILGDNNSAARLLSRPGEAIYNDQGGLVEANSPFQVAWLPDEHREQYLEKVRQQAEARKIVAPEAIVFEGNAPSDIRRNPRLAAALDHPGTAPRATGPLAWLGEPVAIKEPTAISFRRQSGANLLLVGQQEEQSLAMLGAAMVGLAAQHGSDAAVFYVFDGTPADSPLAGIFPRIAATLPQRTKLIEWRATAEAINELAEEVSRRQAADQQGLPSLYVIIYALQRYRILRKQEEEFSFSSSSEEKAPQTGKQFGDILREGPSAGVHVLAWCDTPIAVDRTLDRNTMREFDNRVLFQMSAAD